MPKNGRRRAQLRFLHPLLCVRGSCPTFPPWQGGKQRQAPSELSGLGLGRVELFLLKTQRFAKGSSCESLHPPRMAPGKGELASLLFSLFLLSSSLLLSPEAPFRWFPGKENYWNPKPKLSERHQGPVKAAYYLTCPLLVPISGAL